MTQTTRRVDPVNELGNDLEPSGNGREAMVEAESTRAAAEIQASFIVAKRFPRDEVRAMQRILTSCRRKGLAESAIYSYPKGGQTVDGPSIRLAEALAQGWGNIHFGIIELEQRDGGSSVKAFAVDLETNTRSEKVFQVKHVRKTRYETKSLDDPRDIYEMTANQGARRMRACILAVIPGDVVDAALAECEKTMNGDTKEPLADRVRNMLAAFGEKGIDPNMIEKRLGHRLDAMTEHEIASLRKIYAALKDNMASVEEFFPSERAATSLHERLKQEAAKKVAPAAPSGQAQAEQTGGTNPETPGTEAEPPQDDPLVHARSSG